MDPIVLPIVLLFTVFTGALVVHETTIPKANCEQQQEFVIGDASYKCHMTQKLLVPQKPKVIILEKEVPCPKCKPIIKKTPCGDDKKIFPVCSGTK
jgi:hypothetical protein